MKYRYLDHTSDLGMEIYGKDLPELFTNACFALFDNILDLSSVQEKAAKTLTVRSQNLADLFMDWLRELIFLFSTEYFVVKRVEIVELKDNIVTAHLFGEKFDRSRHRVKIEIKTPTYHMYQIERLATGYKATVIFDV
uniref:Archease n=1 Tax=candidate division WOR-3 bacterium TaxID=2052148 RepID=A0A7C6A8D5_UNCW3